MNKYHSYIILLAGMLVILFVGPYGDFPLNDDWRYGYMVRSLAEGQGFALNSEIAPTLLLQALWGYAFVWLGGDFSFSLLRISTLVLAVLALWGLHKILRDFRREQSIWRGIALLALNPIFFVLAFSFMTDVPFLGLCILSIYAYWQFLHTGRMGYRWLGAILALLALWIRQPGLLIILAFEGLWWWHQRRYPARWGYSIGFILLALGNYLLIDLWVKPALGLEANYIKVESEYVLKVFKQPGEFFFDLSTRFLMAVFYMGLFFLPLAYPIVQRFFERMQRPMLLFAGIVALNLGIAIAAWMWLGRVFPYGGNIFYNWGLGPMLLYDTRELGLPTPEQMPKGVLFFIGLLAQLNGSLLLTIVAQHLIVRMRDSINWFLVILLVLYFGAMAVFSFFDRHLLLIFFLLILLTYRMKLWQFERGSWVYSLTFSLMAIFSILATKDYLSWNQTVAQARQELLADGVPSDDIDAGLAINGLYEIKPENVNYHLSFRPVEAMEVVVEYRYFSWLWMEEKKIYVLYDVGVGLRPTYLFSGSL
jgi:hypothetical protein